LLVFQNGTFWIIVKSSKMEYTRIFPFREFWILRNVTEMQPLLILNCRATAQRF